MPEWFLPADTLNSVAVIVPESNGQSVRPVTEAIAECEERFQTYMDDMTNRHGELMEGLASLHRRLSLNFQLPSALQAGVIDKTVIEVDCMDAVPTIQVGQTRIHRPHAHSDSTIPASDCLEAPTKEQAFASSVQRLERCVADVERSLPSVAHAAVEECLERVIAGLQKQSPQKDVENGHSADETAEKVALPPIEPKATGEELGLAAQVILQGVGSSDLDDNVTVRRLDRMQEVIHSFNGDLTDLRVQVRALTETAKSTVGMLQDPGHNGFLNGNDIMPGQGDRAPGADIYGFQGYLAKVSKEAPGVMVDHKASEKATASTGTAIATANLHEAHALMTILGKYDLHQVMNKSGRLLPDEPVRTSRLAALLSSQATERVISAMIVLNAFFLAYSADYAVKHSSSQSNEFIQVSECVFLSFYFMELTARLYVHGIYFFANDDWMWNNLDMFLVVVSMWDIFVTHLMSDHRGMNPMDSEGGFNVSFLRVLRLLRMSKIFRILRVMRYFIELRMMLKCISMSLRPLFWCMLNMAIFFSIFAISFLHGVAGYLADPDSDEDKKVALIRDWGSMDQAYLSLYKVTTGGADWGELLDSLKVTGDLYLCLFLFFTAFVLLAVLNIMTGIFVDRAIRISSEDRDAMVVEKLHNDRKMVEDLAQTFCIICETTLEDSGFMTETQFLDHMAAPAVKTFFAVMGLEIWDGRRFFALLTNMSPCKRVDVEAFVTGCMQLRSDTKNIAVQGILADIQSLANEVLSMKELVGQIDEKVGSRPWGRSVRA